MDYWETDVYRYYSDPSYARPRKIVDNLKLDWLDVGGRYYSPEVVFFTKADIQEMSGWSEDEVRLLFFDRRFPSCNFGRKEIVEIHALISFFAKKENVLRRQELYTAANIEKKEMKSRELIEGSIVMNTWKRKENIVKHTEKKYVKDNGRSTV